MQVLKMNQANLWNDPKQLLS